MQDAIGFDDGHVVVVNGDLIRRAATHVDETEAIAFALSDVGDGERDSRATSDAPTPIHNGRILNPARMTVVKQYVF